MLRHPAGKGHITGYRWAILAVAFTAFWVTFLDRLAWSHAIPLFGRELQLPTVALGAFFSAFYAGYVVSNVIAGFVTDRLGARVMLSGALFTLGAATSAFSLVRNFPEGLVIQLTMGVTAGADYAACLKVLSGWFEPGERGRAMGIFMISPSVAVVVSNAVFPTLLGTGSWEALYRTLGGITVAVSLICLVLLRNQPNGIPTTRPDGELLRRQLRQRDYALLSLAGFGANWATWGFAFWANTLMVQARGIPAPSAGFIAALFGAGAIVAQPLYGLLSDLVRQHRKALLLLDLGLFATMLLIFGCLQTQTALLIAAPLLGLTAFAYSPLMAAMITEMVDRRILASAVGISNGLWQLGSVLVPLAVGYAFQLSRSFEIAFATLACGPLFAALCLTLMRGDRPVATVIHPPASP